MGQFLGEQFLADFDEKRKKTDLFVDFKHNDKNIKSQLSLTLKIEQMNKIRIAGIVGGILIAIVYITKLDYNNMSWLNNGHYYGVITAALVFSISNIVTWKKEK